MIEKSAILILLLQMCKDLTPDIRRILAYITKLLQAVAGETFFDADSFYSAFNDLIAETTHQFHKFWDQLVQVKSSWQLFTISSVWTLVSIAGFPKGSSCTYCSDAWRAFLSNSTTNTKIQRNQFCAQFLTRQSKGPSLALVRSVCA